MDLRIECFADDIYQVVWYENNEPVTIWHRSSMKDCIRFRDQAYQEVYA